MKRTRVITATTALWIVLLTPFLIAAFAYSVIRPYGTYILPFNTKQTAKVGIVMGAGVTPEGKPYRELQGRLDVAAQALKAGTVDILILSGDNRITSYNEPAAMMHYLNDKKGISLDKLQPDFAGRSTYESCERAAKIFGLKETILFSAESHLPRAIYLCRQFGVQAYGIASSVEAHNQFRREALARVKALINIHLKGEPTVLGEPIDL